jgi:hypothetical protein
MPSAPARFMDRSSAPARTALVEPAVRGGGLEHRVLAADLVDEGRRAERVLDPAHDVQVGHAGLDHDHVGALLEVERDLAQRLVAVGRVHLVGVLVAGLPRLAAEPTASRNGP